MGLVITSSGGYVVRISHYKPAGLIRSKWKTKAVARPPAILHLDSSSPQAPLNHYQKMANATFFSLQRPDFRCDTWFSRNGQTIFIAKGLEVATEIIALQLKF